MRDERMKDEEGGRRETSLILLHNHMRFDPLLELSERKKGLNEERKKQTSSNLSSSLNSLMYAARVLLNSFRSINIFWLIRSNPIHIFKILCFILISSPSLHRISSSTERRESREWVTWEGTTREKKELEYLVHCVLNHVLSSISNRSSFFTFFHSFY